MKRYFIFIVFILMLTTACFRLDDFLYNPNVHPINEYTLQDYSGEVDFRLPDSMRIVPDMIHLFQIESNDRGDVKKIWALYLGDIHRISTDTVILYCHGNKNHMDFYYPRAQLLAFAGGRHRYGVMMIDYRGFGLSEGKPSESGLYADTEAAIQWLRERGLTGDRLVIYGFSMGTAPATELTAYPRSLRPARIILEAPFASAEVFVQDATGLSLPGSVVVHLSINNAENIKRIQQPFLFIHGTHDDFISIETHGNVVFRNYRGEKGYACRVPAASHSDIQPVMGFEMYRQIIHQFIQGTLSYEGYITAE